MKRDRNLIRLILENVEDRENRRPLADLVVVGHSGLKVQYHIWLCKQAGFVLTDGVEKPEFGELTWAGHEVLDRLRNELS